MKDIEAISEDGIVKVVIENLDEGNEGDYNEDDAEDENLLRFTVYRRYTLGDFVQPYFTDLAGGPLQHLSIELSACKGADWCYLAVSDASYCTQLPATMSRNRLKFAAQKILSAVHGDVREQQSVKRICEELSWLSSRDIPTRPGKAPKRN